MAEVEIIKERSNLRTIFEKKVILLCELLGMYRYFYNHNAWFKRIAIRTGKHNAIYKSFTYEQWNNSEITIDQSVSSKSLDRVI